jgi:acyl-CoA hydrolase
MPNKIQSPVLKTTDATHMMMNMVKVDTKSSPLAKRPITNKAREDAQATKNRLANFLNKGEGVPSFV